MTEPITEYDIEPVDYQRACRFLIGVAPGRNDADMMNTVIADINDDDRISETLIAMGLLTHTISRNLRTDNGIEALRLMVANLTRDDERKNK